MRGPSPSLRRRLRDETRALHRAIEARLDPIGAAPTLARYRRFLEVLHGFHAPLDPRLVRLAAAAPPLGVPLRACAPLLARDLRALGASTEDVDTLPVCTDLPPLTAPAHLAGALYVVEGAALGGQVVARALAERLGAARHARAFVTGEGAATAARWRAVVAWLDALPARGLRADDVVAAARATFASLGRWAARPERAS